MADTEEKKAKKADKAARAEGAQQPEKAAKAEKGGGDKAKAAKPAKGDKAAKPEKGEKPAVPREPEPKVPARLKVQFDESIRGKLAAQFGYKNRMQTPVLDKIVINMGIGEGVADRKKVDAAAADLALISGQKAVVTKARMYEFLDRLINIALPRVRDFRGLNPKSFDGRGNYTIGIKEHIIFPEIDYDKAADIWGMDITVCTTARNDDEARALLTAFNFPFRQ